MASSVDRKRRFWTPCKLMAPSHLELYQSEPLPMAVRAALPVAISTKPFRSSRDASPCCSTDAQSDSSKTSPLLSRRLEPARSTSPLTLSRSMSRSQSPSPVSFLHSTRPASADLIHFTDHHASVVQRLGNYLTLINPSPSSPVLPYGKGHINNGRCSPLKGKSSMPQQNGQCTNTSVQNGHIENGTGHDNHLASINDESDPNTDLNSNAISHSVATNDICRLSTSTLSDSEDSSNSTPASPTATKRVTFADNNGLDLTTVKIITEGRDTPPYLSLTFLESLSAQARKTAGIYSPESSMSNGGGKFVLDFSPPVADYSAFQSRLIRQNVCLESATVEGRSVISTVKVVNRAFEKQVFVRYTRDSWSSHTDVTGYFINNTAPIPTANDHATSDGFHTANTRTSSSFSQCKNRVDTFSVQFDLENCEHTRAVEFAVAFSCGGQEFWDNNGGSNYRVVPEKWLAHSESGNSGISSLGRSGFQANEGQGSPRSYQRIDHRSMTSLYGDWGEDGYGAPYW